MSSDQKVVISNRGVGFCGLLFIVLLLLKVGVVETAVMGWSWWLITAPLWGPISLMIGCAAAVLLVMLIIFLISLGVAAVVDHINKRKANKKTKV